MEENRPRTRDTATMQLTWTQCEEMMTARQIKRATKENLTGELERNMDDGFRNSWKKM